MPGTHTYRSLLQPRNRLLEGNFLFLLLPESEQVHRKGAAVIAVELSREHWQFDYSPLSRAIAFRRGP